MFGRRINAYIFSRALSATFSVAFTAHRRTYGNILGNIGSNERELPRTVRQHNRVPCGRFDGNDDILVHIHFSRRAYVYLHNRRTCQEYDSEQPKRKYDSRKILLGLLGTMAMLAVVFLGILIANSLLQLLAKIFQISNTTKISNAIFNACVGDWINGYNINKIDVTSLSVGDIFGGYNAALFGIWPTSWKCNGMVNPNNFMYLPALIAGIALGIALIIAILNLAKRVYEIIYLYFCMPVSMSTLPLDDGARFKNWREQFLTKIILAYGAVLSVNVFVLLLPLIQQMSISGASGFANSIFLIFMIVGGAMVIPAGQTLFARLFGTADDMHAGGGWLRSAYYGGRVVGAMTVGLAVKGVKGIYHAVRRNKHSNNDSGSSGDSSSSDGGDDEKYTDDGSADTSATEGGGE